MQYDTDITHTQCPVPRQALTGSWVRSQIYLLLRFSTPSDYPRAIIDPGPTSWSNGLVGIFIEDGVDVIGMYIMLHFVIRWNISPGQSIQLSTPSYNCPVQSVA